MIVYSSKCKKRLQISRFEIRMIFFFLFSKYFVWPEKKIFCEKCVFFTQQSCVIFLTEACNKKFQEFQIFISLVFSTFINSHTSILVNLMLSDPSLKKYHVRFTTVPMKALSDQIGIRFFLTDYFFCGCVIKITYPIFLLQNKWRNLHYSTVFRLGFKQHQRYF